MAPTTFPGEAVALIIDLVGSRSAADRAALHHAVMATLGGLDVDFAVTPYPVAGDEVQAVCTSLGDALRTAYGLRMSLLPEADARAGIARGEVVLLDEEHHLYDGSAWWGARDAITEVHELARTRTPHARVLVHDPPPLTTPLLSALDRIMGDMDARDLRITSALQRGTPQQEIANAEGISPSAVSQRKRRAGIQVAIDALTALGELA